MAPRKVIREAEGTYLAQSQPFIGNLSVFFAGSTHYLFVLPCTLEVWADADMLVYETDAAHDPPGIPTSPEQPYPGSLVMAGGILRVEYDPGDEVVTSAGNYVATGFRFISISGAPALFYVNTYNRRIT